MSASKPERVEEFRLHLEKSPPAGSFDEARKKVDDTLNTVEDEMSGVSYDPDAWLTDGRMYPVRDDNVRDVKDHPDVKCLRSTGHNTYIAQCVHPNRGREDEEGSARQAWTGWPPRVRRGCDEVPPAPD